MMLRVVLDTNVLLVSISRCAIAGNAQFIVTEDKHFRILSQIEYPKVGIIGIDEFRKELEGSYKPSQK